MSRNNFEATPTFLEKKTHARIAIL